MQISQLRPVSNAILYGAAHGMVFDTIWYMADFIYVRQTLNVQQLLQCNTALVQLGFMDHASCVSIFIIFICYSNIHIALA